MNKLEVHTRRDAATIDDHAQRRESFVVADKLYGRCILTRHVPRFHSTANLSTRRDSHAWVLPMRYSRPDGPGWQRAAAAAACPAPSVARGSRGSPGGRGLSVLGVPVRGASTFAGGGLVAAPIVCARVRVTGRRVTTMEQKAKQRADDRSERGHSDLVTHDLHLFCARDGRCSRSLSPPRPVCPMW